MAKQRVLRLDTKKKSRKGNIDELDFIQIENFIKRMKVKLQTGRKDWQTIYPAKD